MSWRGEKGGITAVKAGHDVIMTPNRNCYLDLKQGHDDLEPNLGYGQLLLSTCYNYKVIPDRFTDAEAGLIKGIQGNLWTESISDWSKLTYMTFPRLYAVAENAWTIQNRKSWNNFTDRLYTQFKRLDLQGTRYATSAFSPWINHQAKGKAIRVSLKTEVNRLDLRYTLDGTEPTLKSELYCGSFTLKNGATVKARAFKNDEAVGRCSVLDFPVHKAAGVKASGIQKARRIDYPQLTDLNYGKLSKNDKRWQQFPSVMEVDLEFDEAETVSSVEFDALRFTISGHYPPHTVEVFGTKDGEHFSLLGRVDQQELSLVQGRNRIRTLVEFDPVKLHALKLKAMTHKMLPQGHRQAGRAASLLVDEIVVR